MQKYFITGMWDFFKNELNGKTVINLEKSFYCGDAAGRVKGKKKDFSDTDYKFALNAKLPFKTPEMLFHGANETLPPIKFLPSKINKAGMLFKDGCDNAKAGSGD